MRADFLQRPLRFINRLRRLSLPDALAILRRRLQSEAQQATHELYSHCRHWAAHTPLPVSLLPRVSPQQANAFAHSPQPFLLRPAERSRYLALLRQLDPAAPGLIVAQADAARQQTFDLLGSGPLQFTGEIDWHTDAQTGQGWPAHRYYRRIRPAAFPGGPDIKFPWELSRGQQFARLGQAYWLTQNDAYAQAFVRQIEHWIAHNPWPFGVNWACAMDVALRAVGWLWGYYFFAQAPALSAEFRPTLLASLLQHGRHIAQNLERTGPVVANHYLANLLGLLFLGLQLPPSRETRRWRQFAAQELAQEMARQVLADGVNFEASVSYHRLAVEIFLTAALLARRHNRPFSPAYEAKLQKMLAFVQAITKPDGTVPLLGDSDNGRVQRLAVWPAPQQEWLDHRYLLGIGAALWDDPALAQLPPDQWQEALWLLGPGAVQRAQAQVQVQALPRPTATPGSRAFPDGGVYVMRHENLYFCISAGGVGQGGNGGHAHSHPLSFELASGQQSWLIDPGTYTYTADYPARNRFRATAQHNTIRVDGQEANRFDSHNLFAMQDDARPQVTAWRTTPGWDFFQASHRGYQRLAQPVSHQRQVLFHKAGGFWLIRDWLSGAGVHRLEQFFHWAQVDVQPHPSLPLAVFAQNRQGQGLLLLPLQTGGLSCHISQAEISPSYGVRLPAPLLRYEKQAALPAEFVTVLLPAAAPGSRAELAPQIERWQALAEQMR